MNITAEQAATIFARPDADELTHQPYRVVNDAGMKTISDWVEKVAAVPEQQVLLAWATDAEKAANDAKPGEDIIIEMPGRSAKSGRPETLTLTHNCFDWRIAELPPEPIITDIIEKAWRTQ